ncbi:MAG: methylenetetrahydromethanopterin dehydrogenase [Thioalkalivibrio sp.]|nr:methylenetetrahydromethanopterin dehydrogenase [Thioalkalivibrio sp.]
MQKPQLLHLFTAAYNASPFDVNMAYDAGYHAVIPYTHVTLDQVEGLTQDAIFSRGPKGVRRTGIFIGGRDPGLASDMLDAARKSMVPPFEVSVFADPSGAYTTAAAMVAVVEKALAENAGAALDGARVVILGGTGPVGVSAAVLAARSGARVVLSSHSGLDQASSAAAACNARYGVTLDPAVAASQEDTIALVREADVVLATAKAGVQVLDATALGHAKRLKVAADVNAVPPAGIEGVDVHANCVALDAASGKARGIGALAVGNIKYQVQNALFRAMLESESPIYLDLPEAFEYARRAVA